jgi:hypothetical protein
MRITALLFTALFLAASAASADAQALRSPLRWHSRVGAPAENCVEARRLGTAPAELSPSRVGRLGGPLARPEGLTTGVFKVYDVTVLDQITSREVNKLQPGVTYDLVAVVEVPFAATIPWIWQIEFGKAQFLEFLVEDFAFPSAGVYFIETTLSLTTAGKWGISIALGGNRTRTNKVKVL